VASDPGASIEVQILLSSAYISDGGRAAGIDQTRIELARFAGDRPNLTINVRPYASVAKFRGAIVEHRDGSHSARLGYYYWGEQQGGRSRADSNNTHLARVSAQHPLLRVYLSWFRHLWGGHRVNTLIFDFDDTLFATTDAQVSGWVRAAEMASTGGMATLNPKVLKGRRVDRDAILKIFLDKQSEEKIFKEIFRGVLSAATKDAIRKSRIEERERLTERDAKPIRAVLNDIDDLRAEYRVIIASATSEQLIRRVFKKHKIGSFSYLFGRNARQPGREWRDVETKAQLFVRLSSMLGIPFDRMIFVGDSDADYRAAMQLGMSFIENTYNADEHKRGTLIRKPEGRHRRISGQQPGELKTCVAQIEQELEERWDWI
jgi:phosphoglycolate phosphatase-like HAD superfamily hydrolase